MLRTATEDQGCGRRKGCDEDAEGGLGGRPRWPRTAAGKQTTLAMKTRTLIFNGSGEAMTGGRVDEDAKYETAQVDELEFFTV